MNFCILTATHVPLAQLVTLVPPGVVIEHCHTAVIALRRACAICIAGTYAAVTIVATPEEAADVGNLRAAHFVSPHDVTTFADLIPPELWKAEALQLLRQATHDYAVAAKYDKAHACAVLAGIKSPLVHELERIAELKQLETR